MSQSSRGAALSRGFASLIAMFCSVILLNLAMGYFAIQRSTLKLHGADRLAMRRTSFQTSALFLAWAESAEHLDGSETTWSMTWDDEPCTANYGIVESKYFTVEQISVIAKNHPEWGTLRSTRVGAESHVLYIQGKSDAE